MPRGGKRPNAGRKAGVPVGPTAKTVARQEIAQKAAAEGITPLEVMLDNMRFFHEAAGVALKRLLDGADPTEVLQEHAPDRIDPEKPPSTVEAVKLILELRDRAGEAAKDAAPYMHSRVAPVAPQGDTYNVLLQQFFTQVSGTAFRPIDG